MGKIKGVKRKFKDITEAEEEFSDNEVPTKVRSSDEPIPKKVNQFNRRWKKGMLREFGCPCYVEWRNV